MHPNEIFVIAPKTARMIMLKEKNRFFNSHAKAETTAYAALTTQHSIFSKIQS